MGKIKQGILGGFSGKVGPVIGTSWKGKAVMKSKALSVHDPNTDAQKEQRAKFGLIGAFIARINTFVAVGYKKRAVGMTAQNACLKQNIDNAISGSYPNFTVNYANMEVSSGKVDLPYNPSATADSGTLTVVWSDNSGQGDAKAADKAMVLLYNEAKSQSISDLDIGDRSDRTGSVVMPTAWNGDSVNVWLAMTRTETDDCSKSIHLGTVTA